MMICISTRPSRLPQRVCRLYWKDRVAAQIGKVVQILAKAMRARYFCVSMFRSENSSWGGKALAMAEGSVNVPQSSSRPGGMDSSLSAMHVLHLLLLRACWQMLEPPHSLHKLLLRLCWNSEGEGGFY